MNKETYNWSVTVSLATSTQVIELTPHRKSDLVCVQIISVTPLTGLPTRVTIGYVRGAIFVPVASRTVALLGDTIDYPNEIYLLYGDVPAVRIEGGAVGQVYQINILGYLLYRYD